MSKLHRSVLLLIVLVALLLHAGTFPAMAQEEVVRLGVVLTPAELEVGQKGTLVATPPEGLDIRELNATLSGMKFGQFLKRPDGSFTATVYPMGAGTIGLEEATLSAQTVNGQNVTLGFEPFSFTVPEPQEVEMAREDYSGLFSAARTLWKYWVAGLIVGLVILGLLAVATWLFLRWRKARQRIAALPIPPPAPIEEALLALSRLETLEEYGKLGTKAHYADLSMLLRRYIEREWSRPAMEMSEDELITMLRREFAHRSAVSELMGVFETASLAKFARLEAERRLVESHLQSSRSFLESEHDRLRAASLAQEVARRSAGGREAA